MCFIHADRLRTRRGLVFEDIFVRGIPEDGIVDWGEGEILGDSLDPRWNSVNVFTVGGGHGDLSSESSFQLKGLCTLTFDSWGMAGLPWMAGSVTLQTPYGSRVIGTDARSQLSGRSARDKRKQDGTEVAHEMGSDGIGCPFAVGDVAIGGNVEAHLFVAQGKVCEAALCLVESVDPALVGGVAVTKGVGVGLEPGIELDNARAVLGSRCWC